MAVTKSSGTSTGIRKANKYRVPSELNEAFSKDLSSKLSFLQLGHTHIPFCIPLGSKCRACDHLLCFFTHSMIRSLCSRPV